jgi:hypothetical protein
MNSETSIPTTSGGEVTAPRQEDADSVLNEMRNLVTEQYLNQRRVGVCASIILKQRLFEAKGFKSARELFRSEFSDIGVRTLYRWAAVADRFSEEDVRAYGITKLDLLLTELAQKPGSAFPQNPGEYEFQIPSKDGTYCSKKLKDCSASEIRRSLPKKKSAQNGKTSNSSYKGHDNAPSSEQISEKGLVREILRAGVGAAMLLVGLLAPSTTLTNLLAPVGVYLILSSVRPLIRLGRGWFASFVSSEHFFESVMKLGKKVPEVARQVLSTAGSLLSGARAAVMAKGTQKQRSAVIGPGVGKAESTVQSPGDGDKPSASAAP